MTNITENTHLKNTLETASKIQYDQYLTGLNKDTVKKISEAQNEPERMLEHRLKCLDIFRELEYPDWGPDLSGIIEIIEEVPLNKEAIEGLKNTTKNCSEIENIPPTSLVEGGQDCSSLSPLIEGRLDDFPEAGWGVKKEGQEDSTLVRYAKPKNWVEGYANDWDDVPDEIKQKFERLGIPEAERKYLAGAGGQFDSQTVYHQIKEKWSKQGIIFEDMAKALQTHGDLIKRYFMKLVPAKDHKFAALHWAVWSGWTFIYVPKWVKVTDPLQAYFRMNTYGGGQFEHTLIIVEDDASMSYIEWCSAPKYDKNSLHAGLVELFVWRNAFMKYSSVENWSTNTYNLNTKRALVKEYGHIQRVGWNLGSSTTMLYPCSILQWDNAKAEHLGIAVAWKNQNQDVGSKVIHIGKNTSSTIVSKSISKDWGISTYRGIVKMHPSAEDAVNSTECDALLLDDQSVSTTIPHIDCQVDSGVVAHEASAGKVDEEKLFYLTSRGVDEEKAMGLIVNGFFADIVKKLPLEYAGELNTLIEMEMEWSVG